MFRYGIDAPGLVRGFFLAALGLLAVALLTGAFVSPAAQWGVIILAGYPFGMGCLMLYESLVWKPRASKAILDLAAWTGSEQVLDVGCGRGLMLVAAAHRLTSGTAVGVDLWRAQDQAANGPQATLHNADLDGVADRVRVETADMRALPFADACFDIVVSNLALHNLDMADDRAQALSEMLRVLRPGGGLLLADIALRHEYLARLRALGAKDVAIMVPNPIKDRLLGLVSFGSYQPSTVVATRA